MGRREGKKKGKRNEMESDENRKVGEGERRENKRIE